MNSLSRYLPLAALLTLPVAPTLDVFGQAGHTPEHGAWSDARTADGQPDLQGHWTNDTYTPFERPAELGDKEFYTPEEATAFLQSRVDDLNAQAADDIHYDDAIWQAENYGKVAHLRTSLLIEPKNGRLPPLTALGEQRLPQQRATQ